MLLLELQKQFKRLEGVPYPNPNNFTELEIPKRLSRR